MGHINRLKSLDYQKNNKQLKELMWKWWEYIWEDNAAVAAAAVAAVVAAAVLVLIPGSYAKLYLKHPSEKLENRSQGC